MSIPTKIKSYITIQSENNSSCYSGDSTDFSNHNESILDLYCDISLNEISNKKSNVKMPKEDCSATFLDSYKSSRSLSIRNNTKVGNITSIKRPNLYEGLTLKHNLPQIGSKQSPKNAIKLAINNLQGKPKNKRSILINKSDISSPIWISSYEYQKLHKIYSAKTKSAKEKPPGLFDRLFARKGLNKKSHIDNKKPDHLPNRSLHASREFVTFKARESYIQAYKKENERFSTPNDDHKFDERSNKRHSIIELVTDNKFLYPDNQNEKLQTLSAQIHSQYKLLNKLEKS
ncbi:hypothetical protein ACO0OL_000904 [Hanseniaspora opuntiae]|uniref:Uncharacterized protein n=1 Tax=Hanseniaspora opuntiae TaxID=211096 RepID=A0A1E5R8V3_9ASCO|nr:hypothetical protein AWRI3578_g2860 [Hanseniaspora opuntiae]